MAGNRKSARPQYVRELYSRTDIRESYLIRIVVEGAKTETKFFNSCIPKSSRVRLEVLPPIENQSAPEKLKERLLDEMEKDRFQNNRQPADQNWIVCDVDEHAHLKEVVADIQRRNEKDSDGKIRLAISNRSFEVWLALYRNRSITENFKTKLKNRASLFDLVREVDPGFSKTSFSPDRFTKHKLAIQYASELDTSKNHQIPEAPGTRVYLLMKEILKALAQTCESNTFGDAD